MLVMSTKGQNGGRTSYFLGVFGKPCALSICANFGWIYVSFPCLAFPQIWIIYVKSTLLRDWMIRSLSSTWNCVLSLNKHSTFPMESPLLTNTVPWLYPVSKPSLSL